MPRIPFLLNYDDCGLVTAVTIDGSRCAATDQKASLAVRRFQKKLLQFYEEYHWIPGEELCEAMVHHRRVSVRPTVHDPERGRRFPSAETIRLPVRSVQGKTRTDQQVCYLPDLDEAFSLLRGDRVATLLEEAVRTVARKLTPRELARSVPPADSELRWITVKLPEKKKSPDEGLENLRQVATLLGGKSAKSQWRPAWGRDEEVRKIVGLLEKGDSSLLLVGASGVGKTTILSSAAREVARHRSGTRKGRRKQSSAVLGLTTFMSSKHDLNVTIGNHQLCHPQLWLTNAGRMISGMQYLGQWEERCEAVIEDLAKCGGVMCLESIQDAIRMGGHEASESLGAFLAPYIAHGQLRIVAETTLEGLELARRQLPGLVDLLEVVNIETMDSTTSCHVLTRVLSRIERDKNIEIEQAKGVPVDQACDHFAASLDGLYRRLQPYQPLPGPAIGLIDSMVSEVKKSSGRIDRDLMIRSVRRTTGLPEWLLRDEVTLEHGEVEKYFRDHVIAQNEACHEAASLVLRWKAGLNNPARPLGVLLLCGPSGVGKTHLAKTMSEYLFGGGKVESPLVRLDMSEYSGYGAAERFLSDSSDQPAGWIRQLRRQPFAVLLLDEIEKASPDVFDCLLSAVDEGRLVDTAGRVTHLEGCVVLMTSNLGSDRKSTGFANDKTHVFAKAVSDFFRPEFFNRLDSVVVFDPLDADAVEKIAYQQLELLRQREGLIAKAIHIDWSPSVVRHLARTGIDARYGARPMQRHIEQEIVAPLARHLASGISLKGVYFDVIEDEIVCHLDLDRTAE